MTGILNDPHRRHLVLTLVVGIGLAAYLTGSIESIYGFDLAMVLTLVGGFPVFYGAISSLLRRKITADLAVALAALAALYLGYKGVYDENMYAVAAEVILIMLIGEAIENFAVHRTRSGIAALLALRPAEARVRRAGADHDHLVPVDEIRPDDVVILQPGDRIPVDGLVFSGASSVDQSPITGESLPADKTEGDEVFAGTINLYGAMEISVDRLGEDTTLEQIIRLVEEAETARAPMQRLADRYAGYFVPIVLLAAGLTFWLTPAEDYQTRLIRAVSVLVVACPCALVLATPTAIAAGIGSLVRHGVLVKGGIVLEHLGRLRSVVFDKTGTLTLAKLRVEDIVPAPGHDEEEVLRLAAAVERNSEHPIGRLIVERAGDRGAEPPESTGFVAHPGLGAEASVDTKLVRVGRPRFFEQAEVPVPEELLGRVDELQREGATVVLVGHGGEMIGAVAVKDTIRPDAQEAVTQLRQMGIERIAMLTGDHMAAARSVADVLGIEEVQSGLLPADKVEAVRRMQEDAGPVAMVGDGINDAPSLVAADVGVAMAEIGADVTIGSADVVLVGDQLHKLPEAIACATRARRIVRQNIVGFALVFNILAVIAAFFGWIGPVAAAVLHQVSSLTVVLNSMRLLVDLARCRTWCEGMWLTLKRRRWWLAVVVGAIVVAAYLLSGLHVVRIGQVAVVQRFGKIVRPDEPPGLHYRLPYPFARHRLVRPAEVRRVEIGFRTVEGSFTEPAAHEWGVQHRGRRYERWGPEADVLTGDENLVNVNLIVQYRVADPLAALFTVGERLPDGANKWDALVRDVAEAGLRQEMSKRKIDTILASRRTELERAIAARVRQSLERYGTGFSVEYVCLADVHPPVDVVSAFREVAKAREEKEATINEAEAEQYEIEAIAQGEAEKNIFAAEAFQEDRTQQADGRARRFTVVAEAARQAPELTRLRLYLQTMEELLTGRRKIILDRSGGGRRRVFLGPAGIWTPRLAPAEDKLLEETDSQGIQRP